MPDAIITSTASTFGTISGTFAADQSTIVGTVAGSVVGTLTGSVGVPGPVGPAGPGSTWGGIVGTLSDQTDLQSALDAKQNVSGMSAYLTKAGNLSGLTDLATARDNLGLGSLSTPTFAGVNVPGSGTSVANLGATFLTINQQGHGQFTIQPSQGIVFPDATIQTTAYPGPAGATAWGTITGTLSSQTDLQTALDGKYSTSNPSGFITASALTGYATESFVTSQGYITSSALSPYLTSATAASTYYPLTGNPSSFLTASALTGYATQSFVAANYAPIAASLPTGGTVGQVLTKNSGTDYDDSWQTLIPGDRYLTTSSTSNTIGNGAKTFTVGTGLSYSSQQDVVISYNASNHMHALVTSYNSGTGVLVVDVQHHTGSGTYTAWTVNVGGTTPLQSVEWGEILGTLGDQTDLATALNAKLESSTAASTYAALAGATFTGEVVTPASTTSNAGLTITPGVAPSAPSNGEIWATTNDLQIRLNGVTETLAEQSWVASQGYLGSAAAAAIYAPLSGATFTGLVSTLTPTTATAGLRLPHGTAPTTGLTNGDVWTTTSGIFARINGTTRQYVDFDGTQTINGNKTFSNANQTLGNSTAAGTINIGTGATISGATKAVNLGTSGVAGSTTNITIGSTTGTSTTTLQGITNGVTQSAGDSSLKLATTAFVTTANNLKANLASPSLTGVPLSTTAAVDTNTTQIATTAFVVGQAASATPAALGTAAVGTSLRYARADHVHANPLPTGGTTAQVLSKVDGTNYNVQWTTVATGGGTWGSITGTLSSQTDLQSALNAKLDSTTAASTYQTISGMSSYLTTAAAATTYYPLTGNPSGFLTSAPVTSVAGRTGAVTLSNTDISGLGTASTFADTAFLKTANNLSDVTASTARTNLGLGTAAVEPATKLVPAGGTTGQVLAKSSNADWDDAWIAIPSAPVTSVAGRTGAITLAVADVSGAAPLASPALTGVPTAPTATVGTNTTQLATTAFVLANAGSTSFATDAQVVTGTSTTTALNPGHAGFLKADPRLRSLAAMNLTAISGSGAITSGSGQQFSRQMYMTSAAIGRASFHFGYAGLQAGFLTSKTDENQIDFSKKIWVSGTSNPSLFNNGTSYVGDSNTVARACLGGYSTISVGDMTQKGIGWRKTGGTSSFVNLQVHNGTSLTNVATSHAVAQNQPFNWVIYSDGSGNVTLYINGTQAATTSAGPTGLNTATYSAYIEQIEAATTPTVRQGMHSSGGWVYLAD